MIYDKSYFEGGAPGGYDAYGETSYHMLSADDKAQGLIDEFSLRGKVLIIGCAYGYLVKSLVKLGIDAYGLDISEFAISKAHPVISLRLIQASATNIKGYKDICDKAGVETLDYIISENMFCCLSDEEAEEFHVISVFFARRVIHLIEDRPALIKWYNYKTIKELRTLFRHPNVTFKIQA